MKILAKNLQTIFDIALQECGTAEAAFAIAKVNDISLSKTIDVGTMLSIPDEVIFNRQVQAFYQINKKQPATGSAVGDVRILIIGTALQLVTYINGNVYNIIMN